MTHCRRSAAPHCLSIRLRCTARVKYSRRALRWCHHWCNMDPTLWDEAAVPMGSNMSLDEPSPHCTGVAELLLLLLQFFFAPVCGSAREPQTTRVCDSR